MKRVTTALLLILSLTGLTLGQSYRGLMATVREIKLLESTRDDVRQILADYNTSESDDHFQRYYNDETDIRVHFSDGTCSNDPEEDDDSLVWRVSEWTVTRIEIEPSEAIAVEDSGFDLSKLKKEQMYRDMSDFYIHHNKAHGLAIETGEDGIKNIIFFPPTSRAKKLCEGSTAFKDFYSRKRWFDRKLENRFVCVLVNRHADVEAMILSATEIQATSEKKISVTTIAVDPENDVLTYNYIVSAGKIVGNGAKVVWDLTGVRARTYTITVGVDDGVGIAGRTSTKTVTVK